MKLTKHECKVVVEALHGLAFRADKFPDYAVYNVAAYLNHLNEVLQPNISIYNQLDLDEYKLPSGLAKFIDPRRILWDVTEPDGTNFRDLNQYNDIPKETETRTVDRTDSEILADVKATIKEKGYQGWKLEDIPTKKEVEVETSFYKEWSKPVLPAGYDYGKFKNDLNAIATALRTKCEFNSNVYDAIQDVNVMSIADKRVRDGDVMWSGKSGDAYVPYFLIDDFDLGESRTKFNSHYQTMVDRLLTNYALDLFTK